MPSIALVAVGTLDKDGAVTETLSEDLTPDVVEPHSPTWVRQDKSALSDRTSKAARVLLSPVKEPGTQYIRFKNITTSHWLINPRLKSTTVMHKRGGQVAQ